MTAHRFIVYRVAAALALAISLVGMALLAAAVLIGRSTTGDVLLVEHASARQSDLVAVDYWTRVRRSLTPLTTSDAEPVWSPDGERIAYVAWQNSAASLWLTDLAGNAYMLTDAVGVYPQNLAWSEDSQALWYIRSLPESVVEVTVGTGGRGKMREWPPTAPQAQAYLRRMEAAFSTLYTAPDSSGRTVSLNPDAGAGWVLRLHEGTQTHVLTRVRDVIAVSLLTPRWSPDGTRIAYFDAGTRRGFEVWVIAAQPNARPRRIGAGLHPIWRPRPP